MTVGRPKAKPTAAERRKLDALIRRHEGNLTQMAEALSVSRETLADRLRMYELDRVAAEARQSGCIPGPRTGAEPPDHAEILRLVSEHGYRGAAKVSGVSPRTMMRRMHAAGVTGAKIEKARALTKAVG